MAKIRQIAVPIICENQQCPNLWKTINTVSELKIEDIDLFYENYDGSVSEDYCFICGELGIAEEPIVK